MKRNLIYNIVKTSIKPLYSSLNLLKEHYTRFLKEGNQLDITMLSDNLMDKWIMGKTKQFTNNFRMNAIQFNCRRMLFDCKQV